MSKWKWIVIGASLFIVAAAIGYVSSVYQSVGLFMKKMQKGEAKVDLPKKKEPEVNEIKLGAVNYQLIEGWNLVSFPVKPIEFETASGLVEDVAEKGGYVTTVSAWDGDKWLEYIQRGQTKYGDDFEIEAGKSYFLRSHRQMKWKVSGNEVEGAREYRLEPGWNTIGFIKEGIDARRVIDEINQGEERATVLDWWTDASQWELYIKRFLGGDDVREYGENFPIRTEKGYMIYVNQVVDWRLE